MRRERAGTAKEIKNDRESRARRCRRDRNESSGTPRRSLRGRVTIIGGGGDRRGRGKPNRSFSAHVRVADEQIIVAFTAHRHYTRLRLASVIGKLRRAKINYIDNILFKFHNRTVEPKFYRARPQ